MAVRPNECQLETIAAFLEGRLSQSGLVQLEDHLESCESCRLELSRQTVEESFWEKTGRYLRGVEDEIQFEDNPHTENHDAARVLETLAPTDDPEMLGRLGAYEIRGVIGCGGMGVVLKGFDPALNRVVAIKVMAPHLASSSAARKRFAREAQAAAAITHDNVIDIYGVAAANGLPYIVMPFGRGPSLQNRIDERGALPLVEVLRIGCQIASGLAAAHGQGLVHRDIKPANILLSDGVERLVITDFGLARAVDDASVTRSGIIAGTPQYMSPEQARGESIDFRSDLFSLGSVLYTACTGHLPFAADGAFGILRQITDRQPTPIRKLNPEVPEWFCRVVQRLHAKSATDRFHSAAEVADILQRCLVAVQTESGALPTEVTQPKLGRSILLTAAVVLGIVAGFLFNGDSGRPRDNSDAQFSSHATPSADETTDRSDDDSDQRSEREQTGPRVQAEESIDEWQDTRWNDEQTPTIDTIEESAEDLANETQRLFAPGPESD